LHRYVRSTHNKNHIEVKKIYISTEERGRRKEREGKKSRKKHYNGIESTRRQIIYILNHKIISPNRERGKVMSCIIEDKKNILKRQVFSTSQILCFVHA